LRDCLSLIHADQTIDNQTALRLRKKLAEEFRNQLTFGVPTNEDEAGLRRLAGQLKAGKLVVKLFLRHQLHAKLYLLFRHDNQVPRVAYLGSSNLTLSGLSQQGELNVDIVENALANIEEKALILQSAFEMFRLQQTELGGTVTAKEHARSGIARVDGNAAR
jgi:NgoFVII-like restriction endonuclease